MGHYNFRMTDLLCLSFFARTCTAVHWSPWSPRALGGSGFQHQPKSIWRLTTGAQKLRCYKANAVWLLLYRQLVWRSSLTAVSFFPSSLGLLFGLAFMNRVLIPPMFPGVSEQVHVFFNGLVRFSL